MADRTDLGGHSARTPRAIRLTGPGQPSASAARHAWGATHSRTDHAAKRKTPDREGIGECNGWPRRAVTNLESYLYLAGCIEGSAVQSQAGK